MQERLTVEEMKARYDGEWLLVAEPEVDASLEILRGRVLFHSHDVDEVYSKAEELRPGRFATIFTGEISDDHEFALSLPARVPAGRHHCETAETVAAVNRSLADIAAGRVSTLEEADSRIRKELRFSPRHR